MNSKATLEQLTGTTSERKKAARHLKAAQQNSGKRIDELSTEEIKRRLQVLKYGTQDEINALEPIFFPPGFSGENLTDEQIRERLKLLEAGK